MTGVNDAPVAINDATTATLAEASSVQISVESLLPNDVDIDGDRVTVPLTDYAKGGRASADDDELTRGATERRYRAAFE